MIFTSFAPEDGYKETRQTQHTEIRIEISSDKAQGKTRKVEKKEMHRRLWVTGSPFSHHEEASDSPIHNRPRERERERERKKRKKGDSKHQRVREREKDEKNKQERGKERKKTSQSSLRFLVKSSFSQEENRIEVRNRK